MYFKRFAQLFVIFLIAVAIFSLILEAHFAHFWLRFILGTVLAYLVLTLPLVLLTVLKARKKATAVGESQREGELAKILTQLPGYLALSSQSADGKISTTIMSFIQAEQKENVFYMVSERTANKVQNLKAQNQISFTTWFDDLGSGSRLSSNHASAVILEGKAAEECISKETKILALHENAANMSVIELTIHSALYENFKDGLKVLDFAK